MWDSNINHVFMKTKDYFKLFSPFFLTIALTPSLLNSGIGSYLIQILLRALTLRNRNQQATELTKYLDSADLM